MPSLLLTTIITITRCKSTKRFLRMLSSRLMSTLSRYQYRWALAAYNAKINQPAIDILVKLVRKKDLDAELDKAVAKLLYAVYAAREKSGGSKANTKELSVRPLRRFIRKSPDDKDADAARLLIAQTAANATVALKSLASIGSSERFEGDVERTAFLPHRERV